MARAGGQIFGHRRATVAGVGVVHRFATLDAEVVEIENELAAIAIGRSRKAISHVKLANPARSAGS